MRREAGDYRAEVNEYSGFAWNVRVPDYGPEPAQFPEARSEALDLLDRWDAEGGHRLSKLRSSRQ